MQPARRRSPSSPTPKTTRSPPPPPSSTDRPTSTHRNAPKYVHRCARTSRRTGRHISGLGVSRRRVSGGRRLISCSPRNRSDDRRRGVGCQVDPVGSGVAVAVEALARSTTMRGRRRARCPGESRRSPGTRRRGPCGVRGSPSPSVASFHHTLGTGSRTNATRAGACGDQVVDQLCVRCDQPSAVLGIARCEQFAAVPSLVDDVPRRGHHGDHIGLGPFDLGVELGLVQPSQLAVDTMSSPQLRSPPITNPQPSAACTSAWASWGFDAAHSTTPCRAHRPWSRR